MDGYSPAMDALSPATAALLADAILILHVGIVAFVVLGAVAILIGGLRGWRWVRGFGWRLAHVLQSGSPHRDAALAQDSGNVPGATVDLAVEGRGRPATLAQHPADRNATGGGQGPGGEAAPLALLDQR